MMQIITLAVNIVRLPRHIACTQKHTSLNFQVIEIVRILPLWILKAYSFPRQQTIWRRSTAGSRVSYDWNLVACLLMIPFVIKSFGFGVSDMCKKGVVVNLSGAILGQGRHFTRSLIKQEYRLKRHKLLSSCDFKKKAFQVSEEKKYDVDELLQFGGSVMDATCSSILLGNSPTVWSPQVLYKHGVLSDPGAVKSIVTNPVLSKKGVIPKSPVLTSDEIDALIKQESLSQEEKTNFIFSEVFNPTDKGTKNLLHRLDMTNEDRKDFVLAKESHKWHHNPVVQELAKKTGVLSNGPVMMRSLGIWTPVVNSMLIDAAVASGKDFQILLPNIPLVDISTRFPDLIWHPKENRPTVLACELNGISEAYMKQIFQGEGGSIVVQGKKPHVDDGEVLGRFIETLTVAKDHGKKEFLDYFQKNIKRTQ